MKYVAALLLGLASVKGSNFFTNLNNAFDDQPVTIASGNYYSLVQTLDWDVNYGTFFTPDVGGSAGSEVITQTYGTFAEFYVSADYVFNYNDQFEYEITWTYYPIYYVPAQVEVDIYRYLATVENYSTTTQPGYGYTVSSSYELLWLDTEWVDNFSVADVSISDYLVNGTGQLYPTSTSWSLSDNSEIDDELWSGSTLDLISIATKTPILLQPTGGMTYATYYQQF